MCGSGDADRVVQAATAAPQCIETERLTLRPFRLSDADDVQRYAGDYDVARMTLSIPHPYEEGMAEEWIGTHASRRQQGKELTWAIEERDTSRLVGAIGMTLDAANEAAEIGYWIAKPYWGRNYATEATRAVIALGFDKLGLHRLYARHFTQNPASGRVMQKAGMTYEGTLRHTYRRFGEWRDSTFYSVLESEYRQSTQQD